MMPILLSIGPVKIYSFGVVLAIGVFLGLYFWWKMGRDEHLDEIVLFDGYFLALMIFLLAGRAGYVLMHTSDFGSILRIVALLAYPGVSGVVGIVAAAIFVILFARAHGWDRWKVADSAVVALSIVLVFGGLGSVLNGSNPIWQINVGGMVWAVITFGVVSRVRKNFRFYAWYKGEASTAQEGLAAMVFVGSVGIYYLIISWFDLVGWRVGVIPGQAIMGCLLIATCGYLIYKRVGRRNEGIWGKLRSAIRRK